MAKHVELGAALTALLVLGTRVAQAAPQQFGDRGQWAVELRGAASLRRFSGDEGFAHAEKGLKLEPTVSYFAAPRLSVGLGVGLSQEWGLEHEGGRTGDTRAVVVSPHVGYLVPLAEHFDILPELDAGLGKVWFLPPAGSEADTTSNGMFDVSLSAPVVWHPTGQLFAGLGPTATFRHFASRAPEADLKPWFLLGVLVSVGGYFPS